MERNFSVWADELRAIAQMTDLEEQKKKLNDFLQERFDKNIQAKQGELADDLKRYTLSSMQQYRTRYLLAKLTQYVDMAYKGLRTPGTLKDYTVLEIEHILPNNPQQSLRDDFTQNNIGKQYDIYKTMLGNLTLLEKPINIVASNGFFETKCEEYKKSKYYLTSSIVELTTVGNNSSINRINAKLQSFTDWNAAAIEKRQELLSNLVPDIWKIEKVEVP